MDFHSYYSTKICQPLVVKPKREVIKPQKTDGGLSCHFLYIFLPKGKSQIWVKHLQFLQDKLFMNKVLHVAQYMWDLVPGYRIFCYIITVQWLKWLSRLLIGKSGFEPQHHQAPHHTVIVTYKCQFAHYCIHVPKVMKASSFKSWISQKNTSY